RGYEGWHVPHNRHLGLWHLGRPLDPTNVPVHESIPLGIAERLTEDAVGVAYSAGSDTCIAQHRVPPLNVKAAHLLKRFATEMRCDLVLDELPIPLGRPG